jgi:anthranilate phosphoribosyltransferase
LTVHHRSAVGAVAAPELAERLEILLVRPDAAEAARLGAELARAPVTADRLLAAAGVLRARAAPLVVPPNRVVLDVVDASANAHALVDVSAAAALLVAACDGTVAHHGAGAPRDGGEALFAALGIPTDLDAAGARDALEWCGFAHLSRHRFHPTMGRIAHVIAAAPQFFALLAPLLNPALPKRQLVGVDDPTATGPLLDALVDLGAEAALVVTCGGAPFLSPDADAAGHLWIEGQRRTFGNLCGDASRAALTSAGPTHDAARIVATLGGLAEPLADAIAFTAGAALWVGGHLPTLGDARGWAADRLSQGVALAELGGTAGPASAICRSRTAPASASTNPRSPRPPRAAGRRGPGRTG